MPVTTGLPVGSRFGSGAGFFEGARTSALIHTRSTPVPPVSACTRSSGAHALWSSSPPAVTVPVTCHSSS